jgi:hypothetical protein
MTKPKSEQWHQSQADPIWPDGPFKAKMGTGNFSSVIFSRETKRTSLESFLSVLNIHCKKNSPWSGIIKLFPARKSLISDIPLRTGKWRTFFTVLSLRA